MTAVEAVAAVRSLEYKPGWVIEVRAESHEPLFSSALALYVQISFQADDVNDPRRRITLKSSMAVDGYSLEAMDREALVDHVWRKVLEMERHEAEEWFKVDGRHAFDPHSKVLAP